jgi:hypothetical protein
VRTCDRCKCNFSTKFNLSPVFCRKCYDAGMTDLIKTVAEQNKSFHIRTCTKCECKFLTAHLGTPAFCVSCFDEGMGITSTASKRAKSDPTFASPDTTLPDAHLSTMLAIMKDASAEQKKIE